MTDPEQVQSEIPAPESKPKPRTRLLRLLRPLIGLLLIAGAVVAYRWWGYYSVHESTDDAYVQGTIATVAPRISGRVIEVAVKENEPVQAGELLVKLDPKPFQVAVEEAQAAVDMARAKLQAEQAGVTYTRDYTGASVQEARAKLKVLEKQLQSLDAGLREETEQLEAAAARWEKADKDLKRLKFLLEKGVTSQETVDAASSVFDVAEAEYKVAKAAIESKKKEIEATREQSHEIQAEISRAATGEISERIQTHQAALAEAQLEQALAELHRAQLDLSYTEIRSPIDGHVGKKNVEIGNFVTEGAPVLAVIALDDIWIEANFREDQIEKLRIGQPAEIQADTYSDRVFDGKVESISAGTGDAFSLLPPENATGNWIKVTRRIPVKIVLNQIPNSASPLRIGMSTTVTVGTGGSGGEPLLPSQAANHDEDSPRRQ